ncbi:MAG: GPW/gp25 family protein [Deltaproteobacteria bacterium]|nr:GPW/gp25 family protein [Deltaproteobacteria bacterium]
MSTGAITLADITSSDWSLELDSNSTTGLLGSGIGNVVQGVADIEQCLIIILTTPLGSDPLRPTFGCDLLSWIDKPITLATPGVVAAVVAAITIWEPRVQLLSVVITSGTSGQLIIAITWQLKAQGAGVGNQRLVLTVPGDLA